VANRTAVLADFAEMFTVGFSPNQINLSDFNPFMTRSGVRQTKDRLNRISKLGHKRAFASWTVQNNQPI
jgi:hypothetical protein